MRLRPIFGQLLRPADDFGTGRFGASRDGGTRQHLGIDLACWPGMPVFAPCEATVIREAQPYAEDDRFRGLLLRVHTDEEEDVGVVEIKLFYVDPLLGIIGRRVLTSDQIATAQDLRLKYPTIVPHVHLELWMGGTRVDPSTYMEWR